MTAVAVLAAPVAPSAQPLWTIEAGQRLILDNVDWNAYEAIGEAPSWIGRRLHDVQPREAQIITLSHEHERFKYLIGRLIDSLGEEFDVPIAGFGSPTHKQPPDRGLEPDQCYYHRNFDRVRLLKRIDLTRDPPPDLAVEIDVTHSSVNRMDLYARLRIPEVWRFINDSIQMYQLGDDGKYAVIECSPTFPAVPIPELERFIRIGMTNPDRNMVQAIRDWVRNLSSHP